MDVVQIGIHGWPATSQRETPSMPSRLFEFAKDLVRFVMVQKPVARLFRTHFKRGRAIEIDITYVCNLSCYNCNRSVGQAPSKDMMTVD